MCDDVTNRPDAGNRRPLPVAGLEAPQQCDERRRHRTEEKPRIGRLEWRQRHRKTILTEARRTSHVPVVFSLHVEFPHALRALRARNYRLFVGGQLVSLIGTWMQMV